MQKNVQSITLDYLFLLLSHDSNSFRPIVFGKIFQIIDFCIWALKQRDFLNCTFFMNISPIVLRIYGAYAQHYCEAVFLGSLRQLYKQMLSSTQEIQDGKHSWGKYWCITALWIWSIYFGCLSFLFTNQQFSLYFGS